MKLIDAIRFAFEAKTARSRVIRFMAFLFGHRGVMNYGNGFWPRGYHWCGWFARETPWPHENRTDFSQG